MGQAVCLTMIVRNESAVIARCLKSVRPYITHYSIVDTGSTDGTQEIIRRELEGLPGKIVDREWVDFSTNRNQSLALARTVAPADAYAIVIDADEELVRCETAAPWGPFERDAYALRLRWAVKDDVWFRRQIFRLAHPWRYEDEIHERSVCDGEHTEDGWLGFEIVSHNDGARNKNGLAAKSKRDLKILRRMLKRKPNDPRIVYYIAQTLMLAEDVPGAIRMHERRLELEGFDEERYSSAMHIAALREFRGDHWEDVVAAYLRAYNMRPTRAEPLWCVAVLYNDRGMPALAELYARAACRIPRPADALVVNEAIYRFRAADELAGALARMNRLEEAKIILERIEALPGLPERDISRVRENLAAVNKGIAAQSEAA